MGDIAIPDDYPKPDLKKDEEEQLKQLVLEGLQIEEEGLLHLIRKKVKQPIPLEATKIYNDPLDISKYTYPDATDVKKDYTLRISHSHNAKISDADYEDRLKKIQSNAREINEGYLAPSTDTPKIRHQRKLDVKKRLKQKDDVAKNGNSQTASTLPTSTSKTLNEEEIPVHEFEPHFDFKPKTHTTNFYNEKTTHRRITRAATARKERVWDYGVIPYEIDGNFSGG
ncbi:hypothetical protein AMK59_1668, partial [Oryctes borbonicus]